MNIVTIIVTVPAQVVQFSLKQGEEKNINQIIKAANIRIDRGSSVYYKATINGGYATFDAPVKAGQRVMLIKKERSASFF
jgi:hypothetical protein